MFLDYIFVFYGLGILIMMYWILMSYSIVGGCQYIGSNMLPPSLGVKVQIQVWHFSSTKKTQMITVRMIHTMKTCRLTFVFTLSVLLKYWIICIIKAPLFLLKKSQVILYISINYILLLRQQMEIVTNCCGLCISFHKISGVLKVLKAHCIAN
jgi:hypothetical protein